MLAVVFDRFGGPEVIELRELADPAPGPGEVLVEVAASTINPTDLLMRSGAQAALMAGLSPPFIAGMEFSGRVLSAGSGVTMPAGTPVIGVVNPRRAGGGAHARKVVVPSASLAPLQRANDLVSATTIPMNALTAWLALDLADIRPGQTLLVTGGTGVLGALVIQLARHRGANVIAAAREEERELLQQLGVGNILLRNQELSEQVHRLMPEGADAMIDCALIGQTVTSAIRDGGAAVSLRRSHPIADPRLSTHYVSVIDGMEDRRILQEIAALIDSETLLPRVANNGVFSVSDASEAHWFAEQPGLRGRVVLRF